MFMIYLPYEYITSQTEEQLLASVRCRETISRMTGTRRTPISQSGMTGVSNKCGFLLAFELRSNHRSLAGGEPRRRKSALSYQKAVTLVELIRAYWHLTTYPPSLQAQCVSRGDTLEQSGFSAQQQQPQSASPAVHSASEPTTPLRYRSRAHHQCHSGDLKPWILTRVRARDLNVLKSQHYWQRSLHEKVNLSQGFSVISGAMQAISWIWYCLPLNLVKRWCICNKR